MRCNLFRDRRRAPDTDAEYADDIEVPSYVRWPESVRTLVKPPAEARYGYISIQDSVEPVLADQQCGGLGADVADALVGDADVGADDGVDLGIEHALLEQFDRRQPQAFLLDCGRRG